LEGLNRLARERHDAGYDRKEHLRTFIVLGRWSTDTCGNFGSCRFKYDYSKPIDWLADAMPSVVAWEDFGRVLPDVSMETSLARSNIPPHHVVCSECGDGWTIADAHDCIVCDEMKTISMAEYVGQTLAHVKSVLGQRTDARYRASPERLIRNDKFIDTTVGEDGFPKNKGGWSEAKGESAPNDDYVFQEGDDAHFYVWTFKHAICHKLALERSDQRFYAEIVEVAGFTNAFITPTPNEYGAMEDYRGSWALIQTRHGNIKLGWRKRVINIDWSDVYEKLGKGLDYKDREYLREALDSDKMFPKEDTTKGGPMIHAWGKEKASFYLNAVRQAISTTRSHLMAK
jgi:hypothetical protein